MRHPLLAAAAFTVLVIAHIVTVLSLIHSGAPIRGSLHPAASLNATAS